MLLIKEAKNCFNVGVGVGLYVSEVDISTASMLSSNRPYVIF